MNPGGEQDNRKNAVLLAWANLFFSVVYFILLVLIVLVGIFTVEADFLQKFLGLSFLITPVAIQAVLFLLNFLSLRKQK